MLCYALERFVEGDVRAEESLRAIEDDLYDAILATMDAATCEFSEKNISTLLQASVFGRTFLSIGTQPERSKLLSKRFVEICKYIRIAHALRTEYDMPVTVQEIQHLGLGLIIDRLTKKREYLAAKRIADWIGFTADKILVAWARDKILNSPTLTDKQLAERVVVKLDFPNSKQQGAGSNNNVTTVRFRHFSKAAASQQTVVVSNTSFLNSENGIQSMSDQVAPFADVAECAATAHRPGLATMLARYERNLPQQVHCFLKLGEYTLAFEQATQPRGDPEMVRKCLNFDNFDQEDSSKASEILMQNAYARNVHIQTLKGLRRFQGLQSFGEGLQHYKLLAESHLLQAYQSTDISLSEHIEHLNKCVSNYLMKSTVSTKKVQVLTNSGVSLGTSDKNSEMVVEGGKYFAI